MGYVEDTIVRGNTIINTQKSGIHIVNSHFNKFSKNTLKEVVNITSTPYSAIRVISSNNNTFDDDTVYSFSPKYNYTFYSSGGCIGNKILSHSYSQGSAAMIGGDSGELDNLQIGVGQFVLFDGDLSAVNAIGDFPHDIRNFNYIIVAGNDNNGTSAMVTTVIPKALFVFGSSTSKYRIVSDSSSSRMDFSFPTTKSIRLDVLNGNCHIRKVIGMV